MMIEELIESFQGCNKEREEMLAEIKKLSNDYPICMLGNGEFANSVETLLNCNSISVSDRFVDEAYLSDNCKLTIDDCLEKYNEIVVVIGTVIPNIVKERKKSLASRDGVKAVFFLGDNYPAGKPYIDIEFVQDNIDKINDTLEMLEDDLSRLSMMNFLKAKLSGKSEKYLNEKNAFDKAGIEYFNPVFPAELYLKDKEVFVDGGAYDGDTYADCIKRGVNFGKYYAFEPDTSNYERLLNACKEDDRCVCKKEGLYSEEKTLKFSLSGDMSSKVVDLSEGYTEVQVTNIDKSAGDATFIKLDIEGSEVDALKGAVDTIRKNTPKLAICAYHKMEDVFKIPLLIKEINKDYRIFYRIHQNDWCRDLILYAYNNK